MTGLTFLAARNLAILSIIPIFVGLYVVLVSNQRSHTFRYAEEELLPAVAPPGPGWRRHVSTALLVFGIVGVIVAYARPTRGVAVPKKVATIMLAVDVSLSMSADDVKPSRLVAAQSAVRDFVSSLPAGFRVGLVTFSGTATTAVAPTFDRKVVADAVADLELASGTAIGDAIVSALEAIGGVTTESGDRVPGRIVLLSDGQTNSGVPNSDAVKDAKDLKIAVSTIALGTTTGIAQIGSRFQPVPSDPATLLAIAQATGGTFTNATTAADLRQTYKDLGFAIGHEIEQRDNSTFYVGIAIAVLVLAALAGMVWNQRAV